MDTAVPDLTNAISIVGPHPIFVGSYSYVYKGECDGKLVAIKVLRVLDAVSVRAMYRKVRREREVWSHLDHINIVPLVGYTEESEMFGLFGALISPWYENGDAARYLSRYGTSLSIEDRVFMWQGVVAGVAYLHTYDPIIIHGDLKPTNILIDDDGIPKLCDFGLVHVFSEHTSGMTTTSEHTGTERYLAPELVAAETGARPTTASDIYAMSCIGLDILFLRSPYNHRNNKQKGQICMDILRGVPPAIRPVDLNEKESILWEMLESCWKVDPSARATAKMTLNLLKRSKTTPEAVSSAIYQSVETIRYEITERQILEQFSTLSIDETPLRYAPIPEGSRYMRGDLQSESALPINPIPRLGADFQEGESERGRSQGEGEKVNPQLASSKRLGTSSLSVYQFGSGPNNHSSSPITCLVPLTDERYLLLGSTEGMGFLDVFPEGYDQFSHHSPILHTLEHAKYRVLWTGEAIYQMTILESNVDPEGGVHGILLALVGPGGSDVQQESGKSVRMYNLRSILSLIQIDSKPIEISRPNGWSHQRTTYKEFHIASRNSASPRHPVRSMVFDVSDSLPNPAAALPADISTSTESSSPLHQESTESENLEASKDSAEDLSLRWATDYVNLAIVGSGLSDLQIILYEAYRDKVRGIWILAIATKEYILLYETSKGERGIRFVNEFYTPVTSRLINFVYQTSWDDSPNRSSQKTQQDQPTMLNPQLALFVAFGEIAGLIRICDSCIDEVNWVENDQFLHHSAPHSVFGDSSRGPWLPLVVVEIPNSALTGKPSADLTTLLFLSKGQKTHIFMPPLPTPTALRSPLRVIHWNAPPQQVMARFYMGNVNQGHEVKLHVFGFTQNGVEVMEILLDFVPGLTNIRNSTKEGEVGSVSIPSESQVRTVWEPGTIGYLGRGRYWNASGDSSERTEMMRSLSNSSLTGPRVEKQGIYVWVQKSHNDYRVAWLGEDTAL